MKIIGTFDLPMQLALNSKTDETDIDAGHNGVLYHHSQGCCQDSHLKCLYSNMVIKTF